ncbi:secreted antigen 1 [Babesia caballi]|uniref:Secreted antigen 1 n=1 Tax=Babesia caballi TaxID=5871 RepID=A0AAV4M1C6_BABCB|nr:secreted antigen 1 [Babesia caballi]
MEAGRDAIKPPETLKDSLDFIAKLYQLAAGDAIGKALEDKVKEAIEKLMPEKSSSSVFIIRDIKLNFGNTLELATSLRDVIVNQKRIISHGEYSNFTLDNRAKECANIFLEILPNLYNTLYYLYFQVTTSFRRRGSGEWQTQTCKKDFYNDDYLHKWLISRRGIPSSSTSRAAILPGGYDEEELGSNTGDYLHGFLLELVDGEGEETSFSKLIVAIIFATDLKEASTAATVIWVAAFCRAVVEGAFSRKLADPIITCISKACSNVLTHITRIAPQKRKSGNLVSLCRGTVDYYTDNIKSGNPDVFIKWVKKHLATIISNLRRMDTACKEWVYIDFNQGKYAGPFSYGFMFGITWNSGPYTGQQKLSEIIPKLTGSLELNGSLCDLLQCLDPGVKVNSNETPQQVAPSAEATGDERHTAETSGTEAASVVASGMVASSVMSAGRFVPSASAEDQTERSNSHGDGHGVTSNPVEFLRTKDEIDEKVQHSTTAQGITGENETRLTHSTSETSVHNTGNENVGVIPSPQAMPGHTGTPDESIESGYSDAQTSNNGGDNSTITIGGATGGAAVLGGGCAALYFLNVGGIKTLITGVP